MHNLYLGVAFPNGVQAIGSLIHGRRTAVAGSLAPLRPRVGSKLHASVMQPLLLLVVAPLGSIVIFLGVHGGREQHPTPLGEPHQQHQRSAADDHDAHVLDPHFRVVG